MQTNGFFYVLEKSSSHTRFVKLCVGDTETPSPWLARPFNTENDGSGSPINAGHERIKSLHSYELTRKRNF